MEAVDFSTAFCFVCLTESGYLRNQALPYGRTKRVPQNQIYLPDFYLKFIHATHYTHDALKRLTQISNKKSNQEIINQYNYSYNHPDFQLDQRSDESVSGVTLIKPVQNEIVSYETNNLNQYRQITPSPSPPAPSTNLTYDENGNLVYNTTAGKSDTYTYDAENRLIGIQPVVPLAGDKKVEFEYDYLGRRVHKKVFSYNSGSWILTSDSWFLYDGWNMIQERKLVSGQAPTVKNYVWGLNLGGGIGGLLAQVDKNTLKAYYYTYDGKGNVTAVIDSDQNTVVAYTYDEFGRVVSQSGTLDQPFQFSTKFFDKETGLNYYGYRFYSPALGRWINRDPLGEVGVNLDLLIKGIMQTAKSSKIFSNLDENESARALKFMLASAKSQTVNSNLYMFVGNNSINYIDSFGLYKCETHCMAAATIACVLVGLGASAITTPLGGVAAGVICEVLFLYMCDEYCSQREPPCPCPPKK